MAEGIVQAGKMQNFLKTEQSFFDPKEQSNLYGSKILTSD